jgi:hypothetical protein
MAAGAEMLAAEVPKRSPAQPIWEMDAPPLVPMTPIFVKTPPLKMAVGATNLLEAEPGYGGDARSAAMKAVPIELVGDGAKSPSKSSRLDERMWTGSLSTETIGKDTPMAQR